MDITKDSLKLQWDTNAMTIKNSIYFKYLSSMELNKCSIVSFIKTFIRYERVLGEKHNTLEFTCMIILNDMYFFVSQVKGLGIMIMVIS